MADQTCRRCARLVHLMFLHPQGISQARGYLCLNLRWTGSGKGGWSGDSRSLSTRCNFIPKFHRNRVRIYIPACRFQNHRTPHAAPANHAIRPEPKQAHARQERPWMNPRKIFWEMPHRFGARRRRPSPPLWPRHQPESCRFSGMARFFKSANLPADRDITAHRRCQFRGSLGEPH
jgi:hypothetical protein